MWHALKIAGEFLAGASVLFSVVLVYQWRQDTKRGQANAAKRKRELAAEQARGEAPLTQLITHRPKPD